MSLNIITMTEFESSLLEELKNIRIALNRIVGNDPQKIVKDSSNTSTSSTVTTYMEDKPNQLRESILGHPMDAVLMSVMR